MHHRGRLQTRQKEVSNGRVGSAGWTPSASSDAWSPLTMRHAMPCLWNADLVRDC